MQLHDKKDLTPLYDNLFGNNCTPDFIAITKRGLIYIGGTKLAEHGGFAKGSERRAADVKSIDYAQH